MTSSRRDFIRNAAMAGAGMTLAQLSASVLAATPPRPSAASYMGDFEAPKLPRVRCALIGVGARGSQHAEQLAAIPGAEIVAISDLYQDWASESADKCFDIGKGERHRDIAVYHGTKDLWQKMLDDVKPDAVFISTPWETHAAMAIGAMERGAHAFVEVPLAVTMDELPGLVPYFINQDRVYRGGVPGSEMSNAYCSAYVKHGFSADAIELGCPGV